MRTLITFVTLFLAAVQVEAAPLLIGTKEAPPFAMKRSDGTWEGISIDLWRETAEELKLAYEFRELSLAAMLEQTATGTLDGAVAAITMTAEREARVDFTHPFYTSGLGIAVARAQARAPGWLLVRSIFSRAFLKGVLALGLVLLAAAVAVWLFERKANPAQFGGSTAQGLASGFWWSAVTMTTVGYGDKAPQSLGGRLVAIIWMFTSVIIISSFTASIASSLTLTQFHGLIRGPDDLKKVRVVTVGRTTSADWLQARGLNPRLLDSLDDALLAVRNGSADAAVYDAPVLRYKVNQNHGPDLEVLSGTFARQDYAIALPPASPLRESINTVMLEKLAAPGWETIKTRYLGN